MAGDAVVSLSGHNDSNAPAKAQSIYYVDINAADLSAVKNLSVKLKLQTANTWETKGAVVANGFDADFSYNEVSQLLTVNIDAVGTAAAEAGTIVSIPVRIWTYNRFNYVTETPITTVSNNKPAVDVDCEVVYGTVNGTPFGGSINVATELTTISSPYHVHDAELTVLNKEATKEEVGYENRTYCETCQSVVDWGTIQDKVVVTHNYQIVDDQFVCQDEGCGEVYESGTGVFEMNGDLYYSINDVLKKGWQTADEGYCYAGSDYKLYVGEKTIGKTTYVFDENGSTKGNWTINEKGTRYSYAVAKTLFSREALVEKFPLFSAVGILLIPGTASVIFVFAVVYGVDKVALFGKSNLCVGILRIFSRREIVYHTVFDYIRIVYYFRSD